MSVAEESKMSKLEEAQLTWRAWRTVKNLSTAVSIAQNMGVPEAEIKAAKKDKDVHGLLVLAMRQEYSQRTVLKAICS
jgi:hypothetical protein